MKEHHARIHTYVCVYALLGLVLIDAHRDAHLQTLHHDSGSAREHWMSTMVGENNNSVPVSRLRGGAIIESGAAKTAACMGFSTAAAPTRPTPAQIVHSPRSSTRTRLRRRLPFWLSWLFGPTKAVALPQRGELVLIQGFDWDLMSNRKLLYKQLVREMPLFANAGINMVWFPPPSSSADAQGYLPGKWYDIPFRRELDLAVRAAKSHGIVSMVDVVLNHRTAAKISVNSSDWTSFEEPHWGEWAIVKDDWKCEPEQHLKFCPDNCTCGALDTGDNACYAPDIDHSNLRVQKDTINWLNWLRSDLGFDSFRFDNTKGYAANYTALYIEASSPFYSVGEYFDTNKDLLTNWIQESRAKSSLFDFGMRYKLKDSIHQDNYEHLMDDFYGPMIWYDKERSVTFLDNHDTAGDLNDRFGTAEQISMGYAVILSHPSLPCIFWQDWKSENQKMIKEVLAIRQRCRIGPTSSWKVEQGTTGLYAAFVGDRLAIKLGSKDWSPNSGSATREWVRAAAGPMWCIWERIESEHTGESA